MAYLKLSKPERIVACDHKVALMFWGIMAEGKAAPDQKIAKKAEQVTDVLFNKNRQDVPQSWRETHQNNEDLGSRAFGGKNV